MESDKDETATIDFNHTDRKKSQFNQRPINASKPYGASEPARRMSKELADRKRSVMRRLEDRKIALECGLDVYELDY